MSSKAPRAGVRMLQLAALVAVVATGACERRRAPVVRLWLAGDVHLGDGAAADVRLAALRPLVGDALGVVNLEGPVTAAKARDGELANHPARLAGLARAGVAVVGVANNHAGDGGGGPAVALPATIAAVRAAGLVPAGGPAGAAVVERGGLRVAITAHDLPPGGAGLDSAALTADLTTARAAADVLVATFHVTAPPSYLPPREAITAVALARAAGAAVIAVHGSHALARVERTDSGTETATGTSTGTGTGTAVPSVTAWGLGNLLFTCECTDEEDAVVLTVTLDRRGVVAAEVIPIAAGLRGAPLQLADDPGLLYDLLRSLRSTPLADHGPTASLVSD